MTATGGAATGSGSNRLRLFLQNISLSLATLMRKPRSPDGRKPAWRTLVHIAGGAFIAIVAIVAAMAFLDGRLTSAARGLPLWLVAAFDEFTDFGKSGWFLIPAGILMIVIAAAGLRDLPHFTRLVLAAITVRLGFVFLAIGIPGLFVTILKRLIGRARPFVADDGGTLVFAPFVWRSEYASIPSGHGTNAFAAAIAIGALFPKLRPLMWLYALLIAASRVVITAHYPSDVIASAAFGIVGAILVRDWFAMRRLGFVVDAQGNVNTLPGPSWSRVKMVARRLFSA